MTNDPFKNFKALNAKPAAKSTPSARNTSNFVEAVQGIGSSTLNSLKNDVVKGTAQSIFDQLLGSTKTGQAPDSNLGVTPDIQALIAEREQQAAEQARGQERAFHVRKQQESQVLFSFADESLRREVEGVRQELAMLVQTMGQVQKQVENAMMDNIVDGGVYHLNYFQKLKTWIILMRKSLEDSSAWLQMAGGRKSKGYFWTQAGKSGTQYSMSSERNVQMSAG